MGKFGVDGESFLALIADIRGSRVHPDRSALQGRLRDAMANANEKSALAAGLAITAGDEFQGLLDGDQAGLAVDLAIGLTDELYPVELQFGLGWGPLATPREMAQTVSELDGPCFHRAREAIGRAKANSSWIAFAGAGKAMDDLVSGTFWLMAAIRSGWTEKQAVYVRDARQADQYKDVAQKHSVVPSVVTESLQSANYKALLSAEAGLRGFLATLHSYSEFGPDPELTSSSPS